MKRFTSILVVSSVLLASSVVAAQQAAPRNNAMAPATRPTPSFDNKRINVPLFQPMAEIENEKAPGRRFLADQTPLSAWSR